MMKHGSLKIICLILWVCITVFAVYGQDKAISWETRILETFNGDDDAVYIWKAEASRFISSARDANGEVVKDENGNNVSVLRTAFVEAWPIQVFGNNRGADATPLRSLGLHGSFDRRGYNWVDVYPVKADNPDGGAVEIPIPGRVINMDCWVWGSNLRYYIDVFVRDYRGVIYPLRLGYINYPGWRNLSVNIPTSIPQARRVLPAYAGLTFVKFRIWTEPSERIGPFYVYFKQLKVLTDMFESLFDGNDLADPAHVDSLWNN